MEAILGELMKVVYDQAAVFESMSVSYCLEKLEICIVGFFYFLFYFFLKLAGC